MKQFVFMLFSVLFVFLSCKKIDNAVPANYKNGIQTATVTHENLTTVNASQTLAVNIDTVPPANAVNVKKYRAKGNGVSDDSNALQNAINAESTIVLPAGTYIITKTLIMHAGVKIYGTSGAIIKAGPTMSGTLLTQGRFFQLQYADNCSFINLEFQSAGAFKPGVWNNACIFVQDSKNTTIGYNYFNFSLPYAANGVNAIWVTGSQTANTVIERNTLKSVGIEYAEAGASGAIIDGNTIDHAPKDALSAHGDTNTYCTGNVVTNNIITNPGMMGIEDWGKVDGTIIKGNTITGCGKDPAQQADGMGISAVGINSLVANNTITDAQAYYIECARNNTVDGNTINDTKGLAIGIIGNYTSPDSAAARRLLNTHTITNNIITGSSFAIFIYGNNVTNDISITSNTITNPFKIGINIDNASTAFNITASNNNISFNTPNNVAERAGCQTYTNPANRNPNQIVTFNNNTINYATTANGGAGIERGLYIVSDNTVLTNNKVYGNNIQAGGTAVLGIAGVAPPVKNITLTGNIVQGAAVDLSNFTFNTIANNSF